MNKNVVRIKDDRGRNSPMGEEREKHKDRKNRLTQIMGRDALPLLRPELSQWLAKISTLL